MYLADYFYAEFLPLLEAPHTSPCSQILCIYVVVRQEEYARYAISFFSCLKHRRLLISQA